VGDNCIKLNLTIIECINEINYATDPRYNFNKSFQEIFQNYQISKIVLYDRGYLFERVFYPQIL